MTTHGAGIIAIIVSVQIVVETYGGFNCACHFTEEITDPGRKVPRALLYGVLSVIGIYLAVNAAMLRVLSPAELGASKLAVGDALARLYGPAAGTAVALVARRRSQGPQYGHIVGTAHPLRHEPRWTVHVLWQLRDAGVPLPALWLSAVTAVVFTTVGGFETLFAATAFLNTFADLLCNGALFVLRRREPDLPRPYRAFGYPWIPGIVLGSAAALLTAFVFGNPRPSLLAVGVLIVTCPLFRLMRHSRPPVSQSAP